MDYQPYLVFELSGSRYGIVAAAVQELFFLPEITPIAEVPPYITGVLNLRGEILPVMDLHRRIGRPSPPYQLSDSVIVLQTQACRLGIIVTQVLDVQAIAVDHITAGAVYSHGQTASAAQFVAGVTRVEDTIVTLLNPEQLVQAATLVFDHYQEFNDYPLDNSTGAEASWVSEPHLNGNGTTGRPPVQPKTNALFAHLSPVERQVLRSRADNVRQALTSTDATEQVALAVMGLGDEYFGLGLETVYEFTDIPRVTPVPCCPPHIVGNMNLRGEIVTLVDIRNVINLPTTTSPTFKKAIVVRSEQLVAGIAVDHIFDVMYVHPSQIAPAPVAMRSLGDEYLQGVASYRDKLMSIINLPKLLNSGALVVCEEV